MAKVTDYHTIADNTLENILSAIEAQDETQALDAELHGGILTIRFKNGKQMIVNKHTINQEIWLASPRSGGLHFTYDGDWKISDGRTLHQVLADDITALSSINIAF